MPTHPIRRYCRSHTMTQREFARLVGVSEQMICDVIAGRKRPSYEVAAEMSRVTASEVTIGEVMTWDRAA